MTDDPTRRLPSAAPQPPTGDVPPTQRLDPPVHQHTGAVPPLQGSTLGAAADRTQVLPPSQPVRERTEIMPPVQQQRQVLSYTETPVERAVGGRYTDDYDDDESRPERERSEPSKRGVSWSTMLLSTLTALLLGAVLTLVFLPEDDPEVAITDATLAQRITELEGTAATQATRVSELEAEVAARDAQINELQAAATADQVALEQAMADRQTALDQREAALNDREAGLDQREISLPDLPGIDVPTDLPTSLPDLGGVELPSDLPDLDQAGEDALEELTNRFVDRVRRLFGGE